jgi:hypothetical protein
VQQRRARGFGHALTPENRNRDLFTIGGGERLELNDESALIAADALYET